ncbi:MAG: NitT/TauT family transport system permease protein [Alphaproteobacteria bacterium]|nr:NitT/TauT family transport system permease protein [Alphaproteobacteria bacterium]
MPRVTKARAPAFPPPLRGRDREGGAAGKIESNNHPSPQPSPGIRAFTPVFDGRWGEGAHRVCRANIDSLQEDGPPQRHYGATVVLRLLSLVLLLVAWSVGAQFAGPRMLPDPQAVALAILAEARSGALAFNLGATLMRVVVAFTLAMALGAALGLAMGRSRVADRLGDPWLVVLLNLPALVIIVLAYVWAGLTETAAIAAVALNKLPIATVTVREGARSLDRGLDDMAQVFRMGAWVRMRHVVIPQLAPYLAAAARSGLSLVWKIVLIVELLGRPNGVGFEIGVAFQLFDVTRILAYALAFIAVMLVIETFLVQPLERHVSRWRPRTA